MDPDGRAERDPGRSQHGDAQLHGAHRPAELTFELKVCDGGTPTLCSTDSVTVKVREQNLAPTANAGADQEVASGAKVTLDGSGSTDPNTEAPLNTLSYKWTQTAGESSDAGRGHHDETHVHGTDRSGDAGIPARSV